MLAAFLFIDKVFCKYHLFSRYVLYTNIRNTSLFFYFKSHHHIIVYYCWFGITYKINQQNDWIKTQIERSMEGETVGINDQNIEIYSETLDLYIHSYL